MPLLFVQGRRWRLFWGHIHFHKNAEHKAKGTKHTPVRAHTQECYSGEPQTEDFEILRKVQNPNIVYLLIMEALYIREHQPAPNTKDEFKERQLRIKV